MRTASASSSDSADAPTTRRRQNVLISTILVLQVAAPLSYYISDRVYDERFSWRMFSTLRLRDCNVEVTEQVRIGARERLRHVRVERDVHVAWLRLLERMRSAVVDAYLERRCKDANVTRVHFVCRCRDTNGQALDPMKRSLTCDATREPHADSGVAP